MRQILIGVLLGISSSVAVGADYQGTGDELARYAAKYQQSRAQGGIYGGAEAVMDVAYYQGFVNGVAFSTIQLGWCPNSSFSFVQIWSVVAKYLADNPASWNLPAQQLVVLGLANAYPCTSTSKPRNHQ